MKNKFNMRDWMKRKSPFFIGLLALNILAFCTIYLPKETFLYLVREDSFFEYAGAFFFLVTSILFFLLFSREDMFYHPEHRAYFNTYSKRIFFFLLGIIFFVSAGEEISWGQRIIGFRTPEKIEARNIQKEFNFHNLDIFNLYDENDVRKTGLKSLLTAKRMFIYFFATYLLIVPLLTKVSDFFSRVVRKIYLPVPAIELGILFVLMVPIFRIFRWEYGVPIVSRGIAEIEEFNFAFILFFLPFVWLGFRTRRSAEKWGMGPLVRS